MVSSLELRRVAAFSNLPDDQIRWFLSHVQEILVQAGETFVRQGEPADWMVIFLGGLFQWRGEFGGDTVSLPAQAGDVSGVFPFSRMKRFTVTYLCGLCIIPDAGPSQVNLLFEPFSAHASAPKPVSLGVFRQALSSTSGALPL
jgi:hypothetical protein